MPAFLVQALWSVLQSYAEAERAIKAALADPAAVKAAAPKRLPGAKDPVDPDEWVPVSAHFSASSSILHMESATCTYLSSSRRQPTCAGSRLTSIACFLLQGPSKYLLEAVLRSLSSLAACGTAGAAATQPGSSAGCVPEELDEQSSHLCSWMCSQEARSVAALLRHPSSRVQVGSEVLGGQVLAA